MQTPTATDLRRWVEHDARKNPLHLGEDPGSFFFFLPFISSHRSVFETPARNCRVYMNNLDIYIHKGNTCDFSAEV